MVGIKCSQNITEAENDGKKILSNEKTYKNSWYMASEIIYYYYYYISKIKLDFLLLELF